MPNTIGCKPVLLWLRLVAVAAFLRSLHQMRHLFHDLLARLVYNG